jgi:hypothetical protein
MWAPGWACQHARQHILTCRDEREVFAQLIPRPSDAIITLAGGQVGRGYPMDVEDWLAGACAIAGRDLTLDEWTRYLPRRYEHSCSDLVDP